MEFTVADGTWFVDYAPANSSDGHFEVTNEDYKRYADLPGRCTHLIDPSMEELEDALGFANEYVSRYIGTRLWKGGGISLYYAGHGAEYTGAMVLKDGDVSGTQLAEMVASRIMSDRYSRGDLLGIELAMDSCFAGSFLAEFLATADSPEMRDKLIPRDMLAASLHDESAWELPELGHGVLTFTLKISGSGNVDMQELAKAVDRNDQTFLRMALQGFVPNPVTFLTEGDQHAIQFWNGHLMEVKGGGSFELLIGEPYSADQLKDALERCRDAGDGEILRLLGT